MKPFWRRKRILLACQALLEDSTSELAGWGIDFAHWSEIEQILDDRLRVVLNPQHQHNKLFTGLCGAIGRQDSSWIQEHPSVLKVFASCQYHHRTVQKEEMLKRAIATGLGFQGARPGSRLEGISIFHVDRLPKGEEYPPRNHWIVYTKANENRWRKHFHNYRPDRRLKEAPFHILNRKRLKWICKANESAIYIDSSTGLVVLVVIREWIRNQWVLRILDFTVRDTILPRTNIRVSSSLYVHPALILWLERRCW